MTGSYRTGSYRNDQFAQALVASATLNTADYIGPTVRTTSGSNCYCLVYFNNSGSYVLQIYKIVSGTGTQLGSTYTIGGSPLAIGSVLKLTVEGARLRGWLNGTAVIETGDFTYRSGGTPGLTAFGTSGQVNTFTCGSTIKVPTAFATPGTFYSTPSLGTTEAGGIQDWNFDTTNNPQAGHSPAPQSSGGGMLRILPPTSPAAVPHNFLIITPVESGFHSTTNGNGLDAISAAGMHNTWNLTLVEVSFGNNAWIGDHPTDTTQRNESTVATDVVNWLRSSPFAQGGEQFWHIGFSRGGLGGLGLIFKHPYVFQKEAVWDHPFDMWDFTTAGAGGTSGPFGTQDNFNQNYALSYQFFEELMSPFLVNTRLWSGGYSAFQTDLNDLRTMYAAKGIQYTAGTLAAASSHNWAPSPTGAWVANAINAMGAMTASAPSNSVAPSLSGTVAVGQVLTCSSGIWSDPTCQFYYQWQTDDAVPGTYAVVSTGVSGNQYTIQSADGGNHVRCVVTAVSVNGGTNSVTTTAVQPPGSPANTVLPAISGSTGLGATLTCSQGTWTGAPTSYGYQWLRNGTNISGATASTYVITSTDQGTSLTCTVTATNSFGSRSATSSALSIPPGPPVNTTLPLISGSTGVGSTLACSTGAWTFSPSSYAYQWKRDGTNISGATSSGYVVVSADQGHTLACTVTATNVTGSNSATAVGVSIPAGSPANTVLPAITGSTSVGSTLTCSQGTWTNSPTGYTYQWLRAGTNISGATSSTYVVASADQGFTLTCTVTASNASGSGTATSSGVNIPGAAPINTVLPAISGSTTVGATLTCSQGTWSNSPTSYAYQWLQDGSNISGALSSTYVIASGDQGHTLSCTVTATNVTGSTPATASGVSIPASGVPQLTLTQVLSDNFNRANGAIVGANNWAGTSDSGMTIASNELVGTGGSFASNYRTETVGNDQYGQFTLGTVPNQVGGYVGVLLRHNSSSNADYTAIAYDAGTNNGQVGIYQRTAPGGYTVISSQGIGVNFATGDQFTAWVIGNVLGALITTTPNFGGSYPHVQISGASCIDTTIGSGGFVGVNTYGGSMTIDNFSGGNASMGVALGAAISTDNFNRANGAASSGQPWTAITSTFSGTACVDGQIVSNQLANTGSNHMGAYRTETYSNDQWATITMGTPALTTSSSPPFLGALVRWNGSTGYLIVFFGSTPNGFVGIYEAIAGSGSDLLAVSASPGTSSPFPTGTTLTAVAKGSRISARINGVEMISITNTTVTSGQPGYLLFPTVYADNFSAGNV